MPIFNLQTLMSQATAMVGQRIDLTPSQVSFWANTAQLEVATRAPHMFMLSTSSFSLGVGSSATSLPSDFLSPVDLVNAGSGDSWGNHTLREVGLREVDNASEGTANGRSNRYAIAPPSIQFYPSSDSTYAMMFRYYKTPADLVNLTDTLSVGSVLRPAVIWKLAEYLFAVTLDQEREAFARNRYLSYMGSVPSDDALKYRSERSSL